MTTKRKNTSFETKKDNHDYSDNYPKRKSANGVNYKTHTRGLTAVYDIEDWLDLEREVPH